jgi:predicted DNA-binding transcriptional regulator AlpA
MSAIKSNPSPYLSVKATAELLSVHPMTLDRWRRQGKGPPFLHFSQRKVMYRLNDIEKWVEGRLYLNTATALNDERSRALMGSAYPG